MHETLVLGGMWKVLSCQDAKSTPETSEVRGRGMVPCQSRSVDSQKVELIGDCSLVRSLQQRLSGRSNRMTACGEEFCSGDGVELHGYLHALGGNETWMWGIYHNVIIPWHIPSTGLEFCHTFPQGGRSGGWGYLSLTDSEMMAPPSPSDNDAKLICFGSGAPFGMKPGHLPKLSAFNCVTATSIYWTLAVSGEKDKKIKQLLVVASLSITRPCAEGLTNASSFVAHKWCW